MGDLTHDPLQSGHDAGWKSMAVQIKFLSDSFLALGLLLWLPAFVFLAVLVPVANLEATPGLFLAMIASGVFGWIFMVFSATLEVIYRRRPKGFP